MKNAMKNAFTGLILFSLTALAASAAGAQEGALVKLTSEVLKEVQVVNDKGEEETRLVPASSAMPGEVLTFVIGYVNEGEEEADDIVLTNPVSEQMVYVGGSATGDATVVTFSVDGGVTYGTPDALTVVGEDGSEHRARPSDYTHIRWQLTQPVPPGGKGVVGFKASVK